MLPWLTTNWGNPSSLYSPGRAARQAVEEARSRVAELVEARPEQVIFTSGATEANNAAIHSALIREPSKRHIVTSAVEHSAVLAYCDYLERRHGVEVTRLPVDCNGQLAVAEIRAAIRPDTALVSLLWANNETGVIWPIADYGAICAAAGVPYHTDAVQAVGKIPVNFGECGTSFLSLSGHKFGAPKGIGALVLDDPGTFEPLIHGGKQEHGLRGGTESVPLIVALGAAAKIVHGRVDDVWKEVALLRDRFEISLRKRFAGVEVNAKGSPRIPNTSNVHFPGMDGDALVTILDQKGICVSSGSACLESAITPSHVILAMTESHERANESLRVSFGLETTAEETKQLMDAIEEFAAMNA